MMILTPVAAALVPCKICGEPAPLYGTVDFNRNCEIEGGVKLPPSGTPVRYRRCNACLPDVGVFVRKSAIADLRWESSAGPPLSRG